VTLRGYYYTDLVVLFDIYNVYWYRFYY